MFSSTHKLDHLPERAGNVTCLTRSYGIGLQQSNDNILWFRCAAVTNALPSIIIPFLVDDNETPWKLVQGIDWWVEWYQRWNGMWFDAMFSFIRWLPSLSVNGNPVLASPVDIHSFHPRDRVPFLDPAIILQVTNIKILTTHPMAATVILPLHHIQLSSFLQEGDNKTIQHTVVCNFLALLIYIIILLMNILF